MLDLFGVLKYDEKLFTILFDLANKIENKKICIRLYDGLLSNEEMKKIKEKISRSIFSNDVSCFI